jgi:hypothetical protein
VCFEVRERESELFGLNGRKLDKKGPRTWLGSNELEGCKEGCLEGWDMGWM